MAPRVPRRLRLGKRRLSKLRRIAMSKLRRGKGIRQPIQYFKRSAYYPQWATASSLSDVFINFIAYLNVVPNYTEFTSLYDQYCIKGMKITIIPRFNVAQAGAGASPYELPSQTYSILDYDGSWPTTMTAMMQYQNLKMKRGTSIHSRYYKPAVAPEIYNGVGPTAYAVKKNVWLDCDSDAVPHYGATFAIPQISGAGEDLKYDLKVDYYLAFKNVR